MSHATALRVQLENQAQTLRDMRDGKRQGVIMVVATDGRYDETCHRYPKEENSPEKSATIALALVRNERTTKEVKELIAKLTAELNEASKA